MIAHFIRSLVKEGLQTEMSLKSVSSYSHLSWDEILSHFFYFTSKHEIISSHIINLDSSSDAHVVVEDVTSYYGNVIHLFHAS